MFSSFQLVEESVYQSCFISFFKKDLFLYVYEYIVVVLMVVSHHVVAGNLNSGPLLTPAQPLLTPLTPA